MDEKANLEKALDAGQHDFWDFVGLDQPGLLGRGFQIFSVAFEGLFGAEGVLDGKSSTITVLQHPRYSLGGPLTCK